MALDAAQDARLARSSASTPSLRSRHASLPNMDPGGNVRVVVRVRAFLPREIQRKAQCLIDMDPVTQVTTLRAPAHEGAEAAADGSKAKARRAHEERSFTFDNSFWSHSVSDAHYARQEDVYNSLGEEFLDHNFEGYHTCIFAYGQTGSGKSYTMMGTAEQPGLIPRTCEDLFERIEAARRDQANIAYNVRVSYFEVYNEHVRDLLVPGGGGGGGGGGAAGSGAAAGQQHHYLKIREWRSAAWTTSCGTCGRATRRGRRPARA
ncbi:hypothetical protein CDD83_11172 [Cordyceps sp. RAO-2017]|nr:hypothetical protein CDD83_11172 [Cordyceps sp. RAO-2017]